ncbi:MAG: hypothetical protein IPM24_22665 [Bryobacterales bacterium]|jgi:hypothetical protein|nr:hypothetical protein [Bryobacterales bacterium]
MEFDRSAAASLWRLTLSQIPAAFGRLVYLSALRDPNTGCYRHFGLAQQFGEDEANATMLASHERAFKEWLAFSIEEKKADLDLYLAGIQGDRKTILETWVRLKPYRNLVPASATAVQKDHYNADLEILLALLTNVHGVSAPDPDA